MSAKKPRILIFGGSGFLGSRLANYFLNSGYPVTVTTRGLTPSHIKNEIRLDVLKDDLFESITTEHDLIINCIGLTSVDANEAFPEKSWFMNFESARRIAFFSNSKRIKMIHISTDHFDSDIHAPRDEYVKPIPINQYGYTKLASEKIVNQLAPNSLILRTNFFGKGISKNNSLFDWAIREINSTKKIYGFTDIVFSPISVTYLCSAIESLFHIDLNGIVNVTGSSPITKFDFIKTLLQHLEKNPENLLPTTYQEFSHPLIQRPKYMALSPEKFISLVSSKAPPLPNMISDELLLNFHHDDR